MKKLNISNWKNGNYYYLFLNIKGIFDLIRKLRSKGKEASILVLGLDNAGKTTILKKLS